ncbi:hypothetical protein [Enterocloster citroniae]
MAKACMSAEAVAPILGISPKNIRKGMRDGTLDLGVATDPKKSGKSRWDFKIYPAKVEKIIGESLEEFYARRSQKGETSD